MSKYRIYFTDANLRWLDHLPATYKTEDAAVEAASRHVARFPDYAFYVGPADVATAIDGCFTVVGVYPQ